VAVVLLLVVGLGGSFTFHAVAGGADVTYTATAVEPGEDHAAVADIAPDVAGLNRQLAGTAPEYRQPVQEAARTGSFAGNVSPELHIVLDGLEDTRFVVYDSRYYDWTLRLDEETTTADITMRPVEAATVYAETARPVESAPEEIQRAVETGTATATGVGVEHGLYVDDGTYYVVAVENRAALVGRLFGAVVGVVLLSVGGTSPSRSGCSGFGIGSRASTDRSRCGARLGSHSSRCRSHSSPPHSSRQGRSRGSSLDRRARWSLRPACWQACSRSTGSGSGSSAWRSASVSSRPERSRQHSVS
jgi:hypothetical protein